MVSLNDKWKVAQNLKGQHNTNYESALQDLIHTGMI
jgi:hypothetical protein